MRATFSPRRRRLLRLIVATVATSHRFFFSSTTTTTSNHHHHRDNNNGGFVVAFRAVATGAVRRGVPLEAHHRRRRRRLSDEFERAGGVLYRTSVLTAGESEVLRADLARFGTRLTDETTSSVGILRVGAELPRDCDTVRLLNDPEGSVSRLVNEVHDVRDDDDDDRMVLSDVVPVEVRAYERAGAGMEWHVDDVLCDGEPQTEVVLTTENTSDCATVWRAPDGATERRVETEPNSVVLIRAGGAEHRVTALRNGGRRVILKFAYARKGARATPEASRGRFAPARGGDARTPRRRRRRR